MIELSRRVGALKPSATLSLDQKVKELTAQGERVLNFGVGEPDFDTPEPVKEAAIEALRQGFTKYTASGGIAELKAAIIDKLQRDQGLTYTPAQIVVSVGAKHSLYNLFQSLINPDDEVLVPAPYWVSYPDQVRLAGGVPVTVPTEAEHGFKLRTEVLESCISPKTKGLVLNSPSNPTGAVYLRDELRALVDVVRRHNLWVISDEIYEKLIYDGAEHVSFAQLAPDLLERTIVVNGLSKAYSMTGWRVGYLAGPVHVAKAVDALQSQSTSNTASISQKAAVRALQLGDAPIAPMVEAFDRRRRRFTTGLQELGFELSAPQGAFYLFPSVRPFFGRTVGGERIESSMQLANVLLSGAKVAAVPGEPFGAPGHLRFSYATSMEVIEEALARLRTLLQP